MTPFPTVHTKHTRALMPLLRLLSLQYLLMPPSPSPLQYSSQSDRLNSYDNFPPSPLPLLLQQPLLSSFQYILLSTTTAIYLTLTLTLTLTHNIGFITERFCSI